MLREVATSSLSAARSTAAVRVARRPLPRQLPPALLAPRSASRRGGAPAHSTHAAASGATCEAHPHSHKTAAAAFVLGVDPATTYADAVRRAGGLLPHQGILENFVHHNPLEALQSLPFREALARVHELEAYMAPGERVLALTDFDPRTRANVALVGVAAAFLDRGAAKWAPQFRDRGFLHFFAALEGLGFAPWRAHARAVATRVLAAGIAPDAAGDASSAALAEALLAEDAAFFGVPAADRERALFATLMELPGWGGMFRRMEDHASEAPPGTRVRLLDFAAVQSTLARASAEDAARRAGWQPAAQSFAAWLAAAPTRAPDRGADDTVQASSAVAYVDQATESREALETEIEATVLSAVDGNSGVAALPPPGAATPAPPPPRPRLQLYTCIDDRECSLRRLVEEAEPEAQTFGIAGFFGVPIRYLSAEGADEATLAPEGQHPPAALVEVDAPGTEHAGGVARYRRRRRLLARFSQAYEGLSFSPAGSLLLAAAWPLPLARLLLLGYAPDAKQRFRDGVRTLLAPRPRTDFVTPFQTDVAAAALARLFRSLGQTQPEHFAQLVVILGHGSASANNPFVAAYNCGACGGREGGPNARLFARVANDPAVRAELAAKHGIAVPADTVFLGGKHNTTADEIDFFDVDRIPASHALEFERTVRTLERARGENALERCYRFLLAAHVTTPAQALAHVRLRSVDVAEARPELNHATNAAVIVGRRELTKGAFFDRRAFLPSYDPRTDDEAGTLLETVLAPALVVCSGINLEYLFSTVMATRHGAGTKAPLNIVGNVGVLQGASGDLRPGLPSQMTEMHAPVRALFVIDAPVARVEAVFARRPELAELARNEWVRLVVRDPVTGVLWKHGPGGVYAPVTGHAEAARLGPTFRERYEHQRKHGLRLAQRESTVYAAAAAGMAVATAGPLLAFGASSMNPHGPLIALAAASLSFPVLAFSRRYLHGEFLFTRFSALSVALLAGFNIVATAPDLMTVLGGWGLFGFASTFLIGSYNERPTVVRNATFAFTAYRVSDFALLTAAAFAAPHAGAAVAAVANGATAAAVTADHAGLVAGCLLLAAAMKSSQFPLAALFVRSMEGPTPTSALGYAGLSAHVGVVLLAGTMDLWYPLDGARAALAGVGLFTAAYNALVARIRPDRKGSVARATSATLGLLFTLLAAGFRDTALVLALGHAALRMVQILRAPGVIGDSTALRAALGFAPWPRVVPDWLYRAAWACYRVDTDVHFLGLVRRVMGRLHIAKPWDLSRPQQWAATAVGVVLAGLPYTPVAHGLEEAILELLPTQPALAGGLMAAHFVVSVLLVRTLLVSVLTQRRFRPPTPPVTPSSGGGAGAVGSSGAGAVAALAAAGAAVAATVAGAGSAASSSSSDRSTH